MSDVARASRPPETVEEFVVWPGDGRAKHYELVDGTVRAMAPPSTTHATIQSNLTIIIGNHLRAAKMPCRILSTPGVIPRLNADENFRVPDLSVTCAPDTAETLAIPDPLLLVEILSPSNAGATSGNIWAYSTIPTLREMLVVRSTRVGVRVLRRLPDGSWPQASPSLGLADPFELECIGLTAPVADIYADTHLVPAA